MDDTNSLDPSELDSAARRPALIRLAERVYLSPRTRPERRARAAFLLGMAALDDGRRDSALKMYQLAYRHDRKDLYLRAIRQFGDTVKP